MPPRPVWWHQLQSSKQEALLAVDLYNRSGHERHLEAFIVHMTIAWTKLLQAVYERDGSDVYLRDKRGRRQRGKDAAWLTKPLHRLMEEQFGVSDPRRVNLDFFIGLRNRIEHRHDQDVAALVGGTTQALVLNYERTLVAHFDVGEGLAGSLHFPLFLSTITEDAVQAIKQVRARLPKAVLDYVQDFDAGLDPDVARDQAYEFRIALIPQTGPKSEADVAMTFVRLDELDDDQRAMVEQALTIVREKQIPVSDLGALLPRQVCDRVQDAIRVRFNYSYHHPRACRHYEIQPSVGSEHPERTKGEFCRWNAAFGRYVYTEAWVGFLSRRLRDPAEFRLATGTSPVTIHTPRPPAVGQGAAAGTLRRGEPGSDEVSNYPLGLGER
jgi:Protein of unknown function (DUF3644)